MILLIADTPVAGTVQRFSRWLELLTTEPVVCLEKQYQLVHTANGGI